MRKRRSRENRNANTMDTSIFTDKAVIPDEKSLHSALGENSAFWKEIRDAVLELYPPALEEWNFPGQKYGWSYRIKDKKRAIVYLLPRQGYFLVAFVFGEKDTEKILGSRIDERIREELSFSADLCRRTRHTP